MGTAPGGAFSRRSDLKERLFAGLRATRRRTLDLVAPLSEAGLRAQHSPLMSPIVWDLCHIAEFEHLWLGRRREGPASESEMNPAFDAARTPRSERGHLDLPGRGDVIERLARVRRETERGMERVDLDAAGPRLLRDGFVYELVREHEAQHQETIVQTILLMKDESYEPLTRRVLPDPSVPARPEMVAVPAGPFELGAAPGAFSYDNERPRHTVDTAEYAIGRFPVSNAEYLEFVAAGGYGDRSLWSDEGWAWKEEVGLTCPAYWRPRDGEAATSIEAAAQAARHGPGAWCRETSLGEEDLRPDEPVLHVCWHEACAFARFAGARLPTEVEWEKAAAWDPDTGSTRPYPWGGELPDAGRANLDLWAFGAARLGAYPTGRSPVGCEHMLGDCWEWTASRFVPYPGFEPYPYPEYSAVFFGDEYAVLRGGSWATDSGVARVTFRNWDYPIRRQILAGFRVARDA